MGFFWRRNASLSVVALSLIFILSPRGRLMSTEATDVQERAPHRTETGVRLGVLSYNVFVRPKPVSFGDETACRSARIGEWLAEQSGLDVAVLTETFLEDDVEVLVANARARFPHQIVSVPAPEGLWGVSGGLTILSRFPIEQWTGHAFETCAGTFSDCLATKGVVWALVQLDADHKVNVVATHLDAGGGEDDAEARRSQLGEVREFLDEHVDREWPTLLTGDFNVDGIEPESAPEYSTLMSSLRGAGGSSRVIDTVRSASDRVHHLARRTLDSLNCDMTVWCDGEDRPDARRRRLDYVFAYDSNDFRTKVVAAEHDPVEDTACGGRFLSDHKAVRATVEFER